MDTQENNISETEGGVEGPAAAAPIMDTQENNISETEGGVEGASGSSPHHGYSGKQHKSYFPPEEERIEKDQRSIFIKNVHHHCTPDEVMEFFRDCGPVMRATILRDRFERHRGLAYLEFANEGSVAIALKKNGYPFNGLTITVQQKRTNQPGMRAHGRGRGRRRQGQSRGQSQGQQPISSPQNWAGLPAIRMYGGYNNAQGASNHQQ